MPTRQALVSYGITTTAVATIGLAALLHPWSGDQPGFFTVGDPVVPVQGRPIDVVFAVDTTGSMGGLIEGAKRTVWSIATHIRQTERNADLRIGLVAYRDIGDDYVTRDFALTRDLDAVFAELSSYRAQGGGDTPEDVDAALDATLHKMAWRGTAKKLVFLVGDAPPASRGDVPRFDVLAREAGQRQIILNTIRCGEDPQTQAAWQQIAALGHGEFSTVAADGGVQQIATPYDKKLAELSTRIDRTAVIVGDDRDRASYETNVANAAAAPPAAQADRAAYFALSPANKPRAHNDLVGGAASGARALDRVAPEALPSELRSMTKAELAAEIGRRARQRAAAEAELSQLNRQRDEYLRNNAAADPNAGFDGKVKATIAAELR